MTNTTKTAADDLAIPAFLKRDAQKNSMTAKKQATAAATKPETKSAIPQAMAPEAVKAVVASRAKAVKAAKAAKLATAAAAKPKAEPKAAAKKTAPKAAAKTAAEPKAAKPKAEKKPKELDPKVVELIALLKTKKGATNEEAAKALKLKAKGTAPHQSASAQVRAMIRDKVRKLHDVKAEHDGERAGVVFRIA